MTLISSAFYFLMVCSSNGCETTSKPLTFFQCELVKSITISRLRRVVGDEEFLRIWKANNISIDCIPTDTLDPKGTE